MRAFLASPLVAACACTTALILPMALPAGATTPGTLSDAQGATHSLPLVPLADADSTRAAGAPGAQGVTSQAVRPFSLVGITWNDGAAGLNGTVQVRTRSVTTGAWSDWQDLENSDDVPDLGSPERATGQVRGGTAPLWVGDADGVQVRVTPTAATGTRAGTPTLPKGLRVDMVDPGTSPATGPADRASSGDEPDTWDDYDLGDAYDTYLADDAPAPRPKIITRSGWGADEGLRERAFSYTGTVKAMFVHHTATGNGYSCAQAPALIRGIYRYHVKSEHWRDIGYNFLIDKCGTIYEGRAGGVTRAVLGAHTLGFNTNTSGVAVIGTFTKTNPSKAALTAIEKLAAWKLSLTDVDANATTTLTSGGSNKYRKGVRVKFATISGHRDGFTTECPGTKLYKQLPAIRRAAETIQDR